MCKWADTKISSIPQRNAVKKSWAPDAEDVAAIYEVAFGVSECKSCKIGDEYSVNKKANAIKNYIIGNPAISNRITAVVRDCNLYIVDLDKMNGEITDEAD